MLKEFKEFAVQGNALDLAVGVIIGGAFGSIVTSLVEDLLMPIIGILMGGVDFKELIATVGGAQVRYGVFIQSVVDFVIIAFSIFIFVKLLNNLKKKEPEAAAVEEPPAPTQEELLAEIRDLMKEQATSSYSE